MLFVELRRSGYVFKYNSNAETRTIVECGLAPSTIVRASALCLKTSSYLIRELRIKK